MRESPVQRVLLAKLNAIPGVMVWRANAGAAKIGNRFVYFDRAGQADISGLIKGGRRIEVEVKSDTGRQSDDQKKFQRDIESMGGIYLLAIGEASIPLIVNRVRELVI